MDLIYLDAGMRPDTGSATLRSHPIERGILSFADFESEVGDEYSFTLKVPKSDYTKLAGTRGGFVYPRGAFEFGGKIMSCESKSDDGFVTFHGRTWLGILSLFESTQFGYIASGTALASYIRDVLLLTSFNITQLKVDTLHEVPEGFTPTVPFDGKSPFNALTVLLDLYDQAGAIPTLGAEYDENNVMKLVIGARLPKTYNAWDFSSDVLPIEVEKQLHPVTQIDISWIPQNGSPQPKKTALMNETGTWNTSAPSYIGYTDFAARRAALYVSQEEYQDPDWPSIIESVQVKDSASVRVVGSLMPDVGDLVTGKDETTGITATAKVKSKTLHLSDGVPIFAFETE